jgi:uncharacterized protein YqgC (DUF456 family)
MNKNLKNKITNICALIGLICGPVLLLPSQGIVIPSVILTICAVLTIFAGSVIGYFTGKNPDGTKKENPTKQ